MYISNISSQPYHLFSTIIKDAFDISTIDDSKDYKTKFESGIEDLMLSNPKRKDELSSSKSFLGMLIGLKYDDSRFAAMQSS